MDFADQIRALAAGIPAQLEHLKTEAATATSLVMPFIGSLGYNVFSPIEVVPEFTADVGTKKGEKVDYAVLQDGTPIILFEVKHHELELADQHMSQLFRYFSVTKARIGVLTNGVHYRFYTDLEAPNKMDDKPFLEVDMLALKDPDIDALKQLTKTRFSVDEVVTAAEKLKYTNGIKKIIGGCLADPPEEIVRFLAKQVYSGNITKAVAERFAPIVSRAFRQLVHDRINERLQSAFETEDTATPDEAPDTPPDDDPSATQEEAPDGNGVVTTDEEVEGYHIVRAILAEVVDAERVSMRDTKSYCGVLLDNNNRKPICRLRFNSSKKYLGLFDAEKNEERIPIDSLADIYKHADKLRKTPGFYGG